MSKSIKFKNDVYLDASNVVFSTKRRKLTHMYPIFGSYYTVEGGVKNITLSAFGIYLLVISAVGNSNIYYPAAYIIVTGQTSSSISRVINIGGSPDSYAVTVNGLTLTIDYKTVYTTTALLRL